MTDVGVIILSLVQSSSKEAEGWKMRKSFILALLLPLCSSAPIDGHTHDSVRCPGDFIDTVGDVIGNGLGRFPVGDISDCGKACLREPACNSFNYSPTAFSCVMYHETQPSAPKWDDFHFCMKNLGVCNSINPSDRVECGWPGISRSLCESRGCCFSDSIPGVKWCFEKPSAQFPDPDQYYVIENSQYPGSKIHGNLDWGPGCTAGWHDSEDQIWRFEPVGEAYYIYNKKNRYHRLCSAKWAKNHFGLFDGALYDDQKWKVTLVGGNKVLLTNVENNLKLGQWAPGQCNAGEWGQDEEQIWELKEVE